MTNRLFQLFIAILLFTPNAYSAPQDIKGSADHPLIGRFDGAWISGYNFEEFGEDKLITAKVARQGNNFPTVEGKLTRIFYQVPDTTSITQLYHNYKSSIENAGFETLFECKGASECGGQLIYQLKATQMLWGYGDWRFMSARLQRPEGEADVMLFCEQIGGSGKNGCQVTVIEQQAMENRMIDAAEMEKEISASGHIALYGIYFDTGKTEIKPESKASIDEIAKLLKKNTGLKLLIVGHTDNQGSFDYNMDLSERRAAAVADELVNGHGIDASRLKHHGAGYLSPVASNRSEDGRAKNRRVELVEQ